MSWPDFWITRNWKTRLLQPLARLVCHIAHQRRQAFIVSQSDQSDQSDKGALPVCVIGNLVVGGSGKTPFIVGLVKAAKQRGLKVGIVSRGYGGKSKVWPQRVGAQSDPSLVGDEPVMLAKTLGEAVPIAVAPKRQEAVRLLSQTTDCDWLISDDGLQHFAMPRQCEIVLIDGARGVGNGYCLPAGPLREPLKHLARVDAVVINGGGQNADVAFLSLTQALNCPKPNKIAGMTLQAVKLVNLIDESCQLELSVLEGSKVNALAGIGNPQRFFQSLRQLGAQVCAHEFSDHYAFKVNDLEGFVNEKNNTDPVENICLLRRNALIMTQKDAVKCQPIAKQLNAKNWWYLKVESQIDATVLQKIFEKMRPMVVTS